MGDVFEETDFGVPVMAPGHRGFAYLQAMKKGDVNEFGVKRPIENPLALENDIRGIFCVHLESAGKIIDFVADQNTGEKSESFTEKDAVKRLLDLKACRL